MNRFSMTHDLYSHQIFSFLQLSHRIIILLNHADAHRPPRIEKTPHLIHQETGCVSQHTTQPSFSQPTASTLNLQCPLSSGSQ